MSPADLISRETKILQGNTWGKILHWKKYLSSCITLQKILHRCMSRKKSSLKVEEKNLTQTKPIPPLKSQMVGFKRTSSKSLVSIFYYWIFFLIPSFKKSSSCSWALEGKISLYTRKSQTHWMCNHFKVCLLSSTKLEYHDLNWTDFLLRRK